MPTLDIKNPNLLRSQAFVDGQWIHSEDREVSEITNPATGELIATVPKLGAAETRRAIEGAQRALAPWRDLPAEHRASFLRRWFQLVLENQDDLARLMTAEQGKPLAEARGEIAYAASYIEWFAEEARRVYGSIVPSPWPDKQILVSKGPVGVCAAITPWNFPAAMITRKVAPALAAGCTIVVKPAPQTPLSALALAALAEQAGLPSGVLSVIPGDASAIGAEIMANKSVRKISFTGSTPVGRLLFAQSAPTLKRMSLELGGNAPFIVFEDADLDAAVAGLMLSKYRNSGQTCVCANRVLVQESVYEAFAEKLKVAVAALRVGEGTQDGVDQGPLIDVGALNKVKELVADAVSKGAKVLVGGQGHVLGGNFFEPTIISGATAEMRLAMEEIFGPVAPLFSFADEQEALRLANDTEFGLAAYFYTRDHTRIRRVSAALEYGMVGINSGLISTAVAPFGGVKQSGMGREGGAEAIHEYLDTKYQCVA